MTNFTQTDRNRIKRLPKRGHYDRETIHHILDFILQEDLTPEYILLAQDAPEEEKDEYQFLLIIAGGNPNPGIMAALTNFTLADIFLEVREFGNDS